MDGTQRHPCWPHGSSLPERTFRVWLAWEEGREFRASPAALSLSNSENSTTGSHTATKQKSGTVYAQNTLHTLSHI